MIELNILIVGSNRTGKTLLSDSLYNHPSIANCPSLLAENKPFKIDKVFSVSQKYNLHILSTSKLQTQTLNDDDDDDDDNSTTPKKKFDLIICMIDLTNADSLKFVKSFLFDQGLDEEYFAMNKVMIVVTREDLKSMLSISLNEFQEMCNYYFIQFVFVNLLDQQSNDNLVNKIFSNISLNHSSVTGSASRLLLDSFLFYSPNSTNKK